MTLPVNTPTVAGDLLLSLDGATASPSMLQNGVLIVAALAIGYFLFLRPAQQERKQKETLLAAISKGDKVIMSSGMHGRVAEVRENTIVLELGDKVRIEFDKSAVLSRQDATAA